MFKRYFIGLFAVILMGIAGSASWDRDWETH